MSFIQSIDWMQILKCFVVGGVICIIGQILLDKTKLTPAKILVIFVTTGAILGGLGVYKCLIDFAGAGATVPLTGFGANLAKGSIWGDYRDVSQHILWGDGSNQWNGKYNYTTGDSKTDRAIHNIPIGVNTELQNGLAGIYYIVNQSIPTFYFTIGLRTW